MGDSACDGVGEGDAVGLELSVGVADASVVEAAVDSAVLATDEALALDCIDSASGLRFPISRVSART